MNSFTPKDEKSVNEKLEDHNNKIWNAAIEAAANKVESFVYYAAASKEIRKLKK